MGRIGTWELLVILAIALLIFGPKTLPRMGEVLGRTIGNFKNSEKKAASGENAAVMKAETGQAENMGTQSPQGKVQKSNTGAAEAAEKKNLQAL